MQKATTPIKWVMNTSSARYALTYPSGYSRACKYFKRWISVIWNSRNTVDSLSVRYAL